MSRKAHRPDPAQRLLKTQSLCRVGTFQIFLLS